MTLLCASRCNWVDLEDLERFWKERVPELEAVLGAVAGVHGVPVGFPVARVEVWSAVGGGAVGAYDPGGCLVKLWEDSPKVWASTLVHELGHHVSLAEWGWSARDFERGAGLSGFFRAVRAGSHWGELRGSLDRYLLDPREVFARAYFQYVSLESGNAALLEELRLLSLSGLYTWPSDEFEAVSAEIQQWLACLTLERECNEVYQ